MPFTKIKHSRGEVELAWRDDGLRQNIEHRLTSSESPRPEFLTALQDFKRYVLHLCELPGGYDAEMTISSVSISSNDTQGRGIVVTALKKLPDVNSPLVLNTPHLTETASYDGGPELPSFACAMLDRLEEEAAKFRSGERAQQELFAEKAA